MVTAPFTPEQIRALKLYQLGPFHSYDCINCPIPLVPETEGLHCHKCGFLQKWAHEFTTDFEKVRKNIKGFEKSFSNPV